MSGIDSQNETILGKKLAALMKAHAARRVVGLLTARGRSEEWELAYEHISTHFAPSPDPKRKHSLFKGKYHDREALKELLRRAASGPSMVVATRLLIDGRPMGRPCVKIVRQFGDPVGGEPDEVCLVIIVDHGGTLVSAYPATPEDAF